MLSFACERADPRLVAQSLARRGWVANLTRDPPGLHLMLTIVHENACEDYLRDLASAAAEAAATPKGEASVSVTY